MEPTTSVPVLSPLELGAAAVMVVWVLKTTYDFILKLMESKGLSNNSSKQKSGFTAEDRQHLETVCIQMESVHRELAVTKSLETAIRELARGNNRQVEILSDLTALNQQVIAILKKLAE